MGVLLRSTLVVAENHLDGGRVGCPCHHRGRGSCFGDTQTTSATTARNADAGVHSTCVRAPRCAAAHLHARVLACRSRRHVTVNARATLHLSRMHMTPGGYMAPGCKKPLPYARCSRWCTVEVQHTVAARRPHSQLTVTSTRQGMDVSHDRPAPSTLWSTR